MAIPKCEKCSWQPKMEFSSKENVFGSTRGSGMAASSLKNSGHPAMAIAVLVFSAAATVTNYFFEEITFKCSYCGSETKQTCKK